MNTLWANEESSSDQQIHVGREEGIHMKLKKLSVFLLAVMMTAGTIAGCGQGNSKGEQETKETVAQETQNQQKSTGELMGDNLKFDPAAQIAGGEDVNLSIWVPAAWEEYYRKWTAEYTKIHPNVSFDFTITSFDDHWKKVPLAIKTDSGPDLFWMHNSVNEIMIPHMEPLPEEKFPLDKVKSDFRQVESNIIDDKLYYVDMGLMTGVIFYNKDIWSDAGLTDADIPKNWDDFREIAKKLTVKDEKGNIQVAGFNTNNAEYIWVDLMYQQGKWLFGEDETTPVFSSPEALKAAQLMNDIYNVDESGSGTQPKGEEAFANQKAAMIYCWGWASNYFKSNFPNLNYGAFPLPVFDENNFVAYGRNNGDVSLGVSKYSDDNKKQAALDFVLYQMCNNDMIIEYDVFDGMAPSKYSLTDHEAIQEEPVLKVEAEMLDKTIWPGAVPDNYFSDIQKYIGQSILINKTKPEDALEEAARMVKEGLEGKNFKTVERKSALADKLTTQKLMK